MEITQFMDHKFKHKILFSLLFDILYKLDEIHIQKQKLLSPVMFLYISLVFLILLQFFQLHWIHRLFILLLRKLGLFAHFPVIFRLVIWVILILLRIIVRIFLRLRHYTIIFFIGNFPEILVLKLSLVVILDLFLLLRLFSFYLLRILRHLFVFLLFLDLLIFFSFN